MNAMQAADVEPTANTLAAVTAALSAADAVMARWASLKTVGSAGAQRHAEGGRAAGDWGLTRLVN